MAFDYAELVDFPAPFVHCIWVESRVGVDSELSEYAGGHCDAHCAHLQRVSKEIVSSPEIQVVDELDFLHALSGGVPHVPDLGLEIVANGQAHRSVPALARNRVHLTCIEVVVLCLGLPFVVDIFICPPTVCICSKFRTEGE